MFRLLICLLLLAGCTARSAQIRGVAPLNRNAEGESTPVDVRIYQLRSDNAFARAGFAALWTDPAGALGTELIGAPTIATVLPGSATDPAQELVLPEQGEVAWIGVQLLVRHEGDLPRTLLFPVERLASSIVEVQGYGLRLERR